jgi:hypothetical protein
MVQVPTADTSSECVSGGGRLKATAQSSVTGPVPAVANYFGKYTQLFSRGTDFGTGLSLAIASWTMGVQHTLNVFNNGGIQAVRDISLRDPQNHFVGPDYIDAVQAFQ